MAYLISILMGYLLGSSSMAYYISKWQKKDIRHNGSGNLGASNATVLLGWKAGIAVAVHDIAKGLLAVCIAAWLFPEAENAGAAAGVASVLGHIFPFYLKFRGGKGLATLFGITVAMNWKLAIAVAVVIFLATVITDYIVMGTFSAMVVIPGYWWLIAHNGAVALMVGLVSLVMFFKHQENIGRLMRKEEIGLRSTMKGEKRL